MYSFELLFGLTGQPGGLRTAQIFDPINELLNSLFQIAKPSCQWTFRRPCQFFPRAHVKHITSRHCNSSECPSTYRAQYNARKMNAREIMREHGESWFCERDIYIRCWYIHEKHVEQILDQIILEEILGCVPCGIYR